MGLAALSFHFHTRLTEVGEKVVETERKIVAESSERKSLESEVRRMLELYEIIGNEMAVQDQHLSDVLTAALKNEEEQNSRNRELLQEVQQNVERLGSALEDEVTSRNQAFERMNASVTELTEEIRQHNERLGTLLAQVDELGKRMTAEVERLEKAEEQVRDRLGQVAEERAESLRNLELGLDKNHGWLQNQIDTLSRRVDDLHHSLGILESRLRPD
jgi:chromosome segregation ATPase